MDSTVKIYQEHGGVLYSEFGRAKVTYFAQQILVEDNWVVISPASLKFAVSDEERELFLKFRKEKSAKNCYAQCLSNVNELILVSSDGSEKLSLLKKLKSEINRLMKEI